MASKAEGPEENQKVGRQRRVRRDEVKRRIVVAAYAEFAKCGCEGASLDRVAEAAGFSKGAVYSNFPSKDDLFFELVSSRIDERIDAIRAVGEKHAARAGRAGSAVASARAEAARAAGKELRKLGESDPEWQLLFIEFWLRCARNEELRGKLELLRRSMRERIAEFVQITVESSGGRMRRAEAMDIATTALALSNGLGIEGIIDPKAAPPRLFGELMARILEAPRVS